MDKPRALVAVLAMALIVNVEAEQRLRRTQSLLVMRFGEQESLLLSEDKFQGDMVVSYEQLLEDFGETVAEQAQNRGWILQRRNRRRLGITNSKSRLWPVSNGVVQVPYTIASGFSQAQLATIQQALDDLSALTSDKINFFPRSSQTDYILVRGDLSGCFSSVGRVGGAQILNLQFGTPLATCVTIGITQHEFLHALGYYHEQSRPDRDSYVDLNYDAILLGFEINFEKETNIDSLGSPYDYGSVMHYGPTDFGQTPVSCSTVNNVCNRQGEIVYAGNNQGEIAPVCLAWVQLLDLRVLATDCSSVNANQKTWIVERYDDESVTIRPVSNTNLCVTVNGNGAQGYSGGAGLTLEICDGSQTPQNKAQRFHFFSSFSSTSVRLLGDNWICIERLSGFVQAEICDDIDQVFTGYQTWNFAFDATTNPCQDLPAQCQYNPGIETVLDSRGNPIGQRAGASSEDVSQLGLLYELDFTPRPTSSPVPGVPLVEQSWFIPTIASIGAVGLTALLALSFFVIRSRFSSFGRSVLMA